MNILISAVGRQSFLVNAFKEALKGRGKVFATDCDENAKALKIADKSFIAPPFSSEKYILWMLDICKNHKIELLLSFNVDDIIILEKYNKAFSNIGCILLGADYEIVLKTNDKYQLPSLSKELHLPSAKTWLMDAQFNIKQCDQFPLIAKPRFGKGARGNEIIHNINELKQFISTTSKNTPYVIQEMLEGVEYGFDIINDLQGNFLRVLGRRKITQKGGESFQAKTINPAFWENTARIWSEKLKHKGTANFDVIFKDGKGYLIDINLRFSGDYIFSHLAGANTPQIIVDNFRKKKIENNQYCPQFEIVGERTEDGAKRI